MSMLKEKHIQFLKEETYFHEIYDTFEEFIRDHDYDEFEELQEQMYSIASSGKSERSKIAAFVADYMELIWFTDEEDDLFNEPGAELLEQIITSKEIKDAPVNLTLKPHRGNVTPLTSEYKHLGHLLFINDSSLSGR